MFGGIGELGIRLGSFTAILNQLETQLEKFVRTVVDSNRGLSQWNGNIANSFAQSGFREQQREIDLGKNTEGGVVLLNESFQDLLDETQQLREMSARALNYTAILAANTAKILTIVMKYSPFIQLSNLLLERIEKEIKERLGMGGGDQFDQLIQAAMGAAQPQPPAGAGAANPPPAPQRPKWVDPLGMEGAGDRLRRVLGGGG